MRRKPQTPEKIADGHCAGCGGYPRNLTLVGPGERYRCRDCAANGDRPAAEAIPGSNDSKQLKKRRGTSRREAQAKRRDLMFLIVTPKGVTVEVKVHGSGDWNAGDVRNLVRQLRDGVNRWAHDSESPEIGVPPAVYDGEGSQYPC